MIESYYTAVQRFLRAKLRGSDWAEDLTQETFARALATSGALDDARAATRQAWLFQIAGNLAVDFGRRERAVPPCRTSTCAFGQLTVNEPRTFSLSATFDF